MVIERSSSTCQNDLHIICGREVFNVYHVLYIVDARLCVPYASYNIVYCTFRARVHALIGSSVRLRIYIYKSLLSQ